MIIASPGRVAGRGFRLRDPARAGRPDALLCGSSANGAADPGLPVRCTTWKGPTVPKRNYGQAKRQREASREQKKAEKLQRKMERMQDLPADDSAAPDAPEAPPQR